MHTNSTLTLDSSVISSCFKKTFYPIAYEKIRGYPDQVVARIVPGRVISCGRYYQLLAQVNTHCQARLGSRSDNLTCIGIPAEPQKSQDGINLFVVATVAGAV